MSKKDDGDVEFYEKPGQRYPTPSPGSGDRVFYESLLKEKPGSKMALVWMIEHGCYSKDEQSKLIPAYTKAKEELK